MSSGQSTLSVAAALAAVVLGAVAASAQIAPPDVTVTPKPVGSGARALGQSAFIGVADDATAASWNPAGLVQLERPEVSFVGAWLHSLDRFSSNSTDVTIGREAWAQPEINFASVAYPFAVGGRDVVTSLNYHQVYDFGMDLSFIQDLRGAGTFLPQAIHVKSEGAVSATSLGAGVSLSPTLAVGGSLNLYHNGLYARDAWRVKTRASGSGTLANVPVTFGYTNRETFDDFHGWNATLGLLWDAWAREGRSLTLGCVVHTPYTATVHRTSESVTSLLGAVNWFKTDQRIEMDFPASVGAGLSYRISDAWSVACDVQWTDWSRFEQRDETAHRTSPIGGAPTGNLDDVVAARVGTEYLFILEDAVIALRGGLFYEPRPALGDPMGVLGYSVGGGWSTNLFSFDLAYQFRWGESVGGRNLGLSSATSFEVKEHWLVASVIFYF